MLTDKTGEAATRDLEAWAGRIASQVDTGVGVGVTYEAESHMFILRLIKGPRILIFRLSETQVHNPEREAECERTLLRKIKDLWNLL